VTSTQVVSAPAGTSTLRGAWQRAATQLDPVTGSTRRPAAWSFLASLILSLVAAFAWGAPTYRYGDSAGYWDLGITFVHHGSFSFTGFTSATWGYVFPLYDLVLHEIATTLDVSALTTIRVANCLVLASLASVTIPKMASAIWPAVQLTAVRRVLLMIVLLIFWRGWLNFALTDFIGLLLLLTALSFLVRTPSVVRYVLAGLFAALACNIRPTFLPELLVMVVLMGRSLLTSRTPVVEGAPSHRRRLTTGQRAIVCVAGFVVGFLVVSLPQSWLNHTHYATWSPVAGAPAKLDIGEINGGMTYLRFESVVVNHQAAGIVYPDVSTTRLLQSLPGKTVTGYGDYATVVARHPLVMVGAFGRRLMNAFDVHYSTPYTPHLVVGPDGLDLLSCSLWFLAALRLVLRRSRRLLGSMDWIYLAALALVCVAVLPALIEPRFMLTGDVAAYVLLLAPGWSDLFISVRAQGRRRIDWKCVVATSTAYLAWVAVWFAVMGAILATTQTL
jgi:hypothetical protein